MATLSRHGMSPLVATVLLIAFAISLGVVVMSFGSAYYPHEKLTSRVVNESTLCSSLSLEILSIQNQEQLCYRGDSRTGTVEFVLVNSANTPIDSIQMWVVGDSILVSDILNQTLAPGYPLEGRLDYSLEQNGKIRQVKFVPKISPEGTAQSLFCFEKAVTATAVRDC